MKTPGDVNPREEPPLALDMPLEQAIRTQRSIRRLEPDPVDDSRRETTLSAAESSGTTRTWAPFV